MEHSNFIHFSTDPWLFRYECTEKLKKKKTLLFGFKERIKDCIHFFSSVQIV